ncbi:MAG: hypothetical protein HY319_09060 [Armatimonadetes bacterium]|nr:hypothetical protein [Armatimonadota bacterium]
MARAVAVGEKHLILGFQGVGFEVVPVADPTAFSRELARLSRDRQVGLVLVTESIAEQIPAALEDFRSRSQAILTVIPTQEGSRRTSFDQLRKIVERSLGVDLLGKES